MIVWMVVTTCYLLFVMIDALEVQNSRILYFFAIAHHDGVLGLPGSQWQRACLFE